MKPTLFFDLDGVILNSMEFHVRAWQEALSSFGFSVDAEVLYLHEGAIEPENAALIFSQNGCPIDEKEFKKILLRQIEIFSAKYKELVKPYKDVIPLLSALKEKGWQMAIVTSSNEYIIEQVLSEDIVSFMSHIITGDKVKRRKPWPDPYLAALEAMGTEPGQGIAVENAPAGITSALKAGLKCIALTTTLPEAYLSHAHKVLPSHKALHEYLCL